MLAPHPRNDRESRWRLLAKTEEGTRQPSDLTAECWRGPRPSTATLP